LARTSENNSVRPIAPMSELGSMQSKSPKLLCGYFVAEKRSLRPGCRGHWRVHRFMMLPPTQLEGRRTYGLENLSSAMQKGFFDSFDPIPTCLQLEAL